MTPHLIHRDEADRVRREAGEIATWMTDLGTAAGSVPGSTSIIQT